MAQDDHSSVCTCIFMSGFAHAGAWAYVYIHTFSKTAQAYCTSQNLCCLSKRIAEISCQPCYVAMALRHLTIQSLRGSGDSHALGLITMGLRTIMPCSSDLGASGREQLRTFCREIAAFFLQQLQSIVALFFWCRSLLGLVVL